MTSVFRVSQLLSFSYLQISKRYLLIYLDLFGFMLDTEVR